MDERARRALALMGDGEADDAPSSADCRPWSRDDYDSRLRTFTPGTWFAKPEAIGPQPCARYGWVNSGFDEISCASCGAALKFGFGGLNVGDADAAAQRFRAHLSQGHEESCPWRGSPSPVAFTAFPTNAIQSSAFLARRSALTAAFACAGGNEEKECGAGVRLAVALSQEDGAALATLLPDHNHEAGAGAPGAPAESSCQYLTSWGAEGASVASGGAGVAAAFGWEPYISGPGGSVATGVQCRLCGRIVGATACSDSTGSGLPAKRARVGSDGESSSDANVVGLSPSGDHRWFCGWVRSSGDGASKPGWFTCVAGLTSTSQEGAAGSCGAGASTAVSSGVSAAAVRALLKKL